MGDVVQATARRVKAALIAGSALLATACANEPSPRVMGYQTSVQPVAATGAFTAEPGGRAQRAGHTVPVRKSMADKILAAIALERVTGRKPDPSRLAEAR